MTEQPADPVGGWLARFAATHANADVLDVGGGSGTRAVPLALSGCAVLVVDSSTDALASLARRAADAGVSGRITAVQGDADQLADLVPAESVDLVLYHHLVQEVDDPQRSLAAAAAIARPGGTVSVLVPGRLAAVVGAVLAGRRGDAIDALDGDPDRDRRYDGPALRQLIEQAGLVVEGVAGVGVIAAFLGHAGRGALADGDGWEDVERRLAGHPVLGQLAGDLHGIGIRPAR